MQSRRILRNKYIKPEKLNRKRRFIRLIVLIFFIFIFISILLNYMKVKVVSVKPSNEDQSVLISKYSTDLSKVVIDSNMVLFNAKSVSINVDDHNIKFDIDRVVKEYPGHITIYINIPDDYLTISDGISYFHISTNGLVLRKVSDKSNSVIPIINQELIVGDFVDLSIINTLNIILNDPYFINVNSFNITKSAVIIKDSRGYEVIFPVLNDETILLDKLKLLKKIAQQYTIDSRGVDTIDLRYSKPVIKFN